MRLDVASLTRSLQGSLAVDEFIVSESRARIAIEEIGSGAARQELLPHSLEATLYVDRKQGRGTSTLTPAYDQLLSSQLQDAITRAFGALGTVWQLPVPAAPARVPVHDQSASQSPRETARRLLSEFTKALPASVRAPSARVIVEHRNSRAVLSNGFDNQYESTDILLEATVVADGGDPTPLLLRTRRMAGINVAIAEALERARQQSLDGARGILVEPGMIDLAILSSAYHPRQSSDFGLWTPLVQQASASRLRAGMSTHTRGRSLLASPSRGDTLSLESVGTEPFALRSAPFTSDGQAIRNFSLVEANLATGVSVDHQESALGAGPANGGVRRLLLGSGVSGADEIGRPGSKPMLMVHRLSSVRTAGPGTLFLEVASGELRRRDALGRVQSTPVHSALVCGNLYQWLRDAHFSREQNDENWFLGPQVIRFNNVRAH